MAHHVLVVDDDPDIRAVIARVLEDEGFRAATAANGREALARIATDPPAVVLLDLNMPIMTGWEVQAWLRDQRIATAVVFMTAGEQACREAARHGADDCLPKPFALDDLLRVVLRFTADSTT